MLEVVTICVKFFYQQVIVDTSWASLKNCTENLVIVIFGALRDLVSFVFDLTLFNEYFSLF